MHFPRFTYTDDAAAAVDFTLIRPCRSWIPGSEGIGGREFSANRAAVASYEVRRDQTLSLTLRFTEAEWAQIRKLLEHGTRGTLITVYLDGTNRECYLLTPALGERVEPQRAEYPGDFEIQTVWVDSTDVGWDAVTFYG